MGEAAALSFGAFRLAGRAGPLTRGGVEIRLQSKALAVLWTLARQPGAVVSKAELFDAVWPRLVVEDNALTFQIKALRQALDDDSKAPRYIATVHRVGYRFVAPVLSANQPDGAALPGVSPALVGRDAELAQLFAPFPHTVADQARFVGRDAQLARLHQHYARALCGMRQIVFVSGEAGIGKTSLVERFLAQLNEVPRIGRGQCVEQHGAGEGYLPVLDALDRICRQPRGGQVIDVLLKIAPTWLMQLPALVSKDDLATLQQRIAGAARGRMLREIADALEALSSDNPLILVLEDLHWSDPSTVEMLSLVARRSEAARLLVLGTYRPVDVIISSHPLKAVKQELVGKGQAEDLALGNLRPADVRSYLARRFPDTGDERAVSDFVYRRTEGHPLFMVQMADYLAEANAQESGAVGVPGSLGAPLESAVPLGLQELIEVQLGRLTDPERQMLEIASVAGAEFAAASLAAGAARLATIEDVEALCERMARAGQFIEDRGLATWPDGTVSGRFGFRHALYQDVLYRRQGSGQRARVHLAIGMREESGYGERSTEIAAELAVHFERGRELSRAIHHRQQAGEKALQRSANTEAVDHFTKGLDLLAALPEPLPDEPERARRELRLLIGLSLALTMTKGYSAPEVEGVSARARELCRQMDETPEVFSAVFRVQQFYHARADLTTARELCEQLLRIARHAGTPALLSRAHTALAFVRESRGDFIAAVEHVAQSLAHYDPRHYVALGAASGDDPRAVGLVVRMSALQALGYADQARASLQECMAVAIALGFPYARCAILTSAADLHTLRRDERAVRESAEAALAISTREGFPWFAARATMLRGWALSEQGQAEAGVAQLREGLAAFRSMGARLWMPRYLGLMAEACGKVGQIDEGLAALAEALELVRRTDDRQYEAELHRLQGELMLAMRPVRSAEAEECFHEAIAVARRQQAKSYELRASVSLARSWHRQGKQKAAHQMLSGIFDWFTEGFDTKDLRAAKTLLSEPTAERSA